MYPEHAKKAMEMLSYVRDERRPLGTDDQESVGSKPPRAAVLKAMAVRVAEKRDMIPSGEVQRDERKRTVHELPESYR